MGNTERTIIEPTKKLKVLVACEESQVVCKAFRERGHEAYSCDIQPCSGGHPEWHKQQDALECFSSFDTSDREPRTTLNLFGAHPPCTYLCNSGVRWLYNKNGSINKDRWRDMEKAAWFFRMMLSKLKIVGHGYIENPIMHKHAMNLIKVKPTQVIQPYQFGHGEKKATCLWVYGLPDLKPTKIVEGREQRIWKLPPSEGRAKLRSKTYPGIAMAMAEQWG